MNKVYLALPFFLACNSSAIATNWQYTIIVDAGSSGSRLHLFQYDASNSMPNIQDIFSEKNSLPLASYADNPQQAGLSLKTMLDDAQTKLVQLHIDPHAVPISVLGTAGMRLIKLQDQTAIYDSTQSYLKQYYTFPIDRIETITGKMEGVYAWLDINYLSHSFEGLSNTLGSVDMGGASTEITFETQDNNHPADEMTLNINNRLYSVYSKSFLGLGQDQARDSIDVIPSAGACYPADYITSTGTVGQFDYGKCQQLYDQVIDSIMTQPILKPSPTQKFIAFSGAYYSYHFFGVDQTPQQNIVESRIQQVCRESWSQLKTDYPNENEAYLSNYCPNATYVTDLYYYHYGLTGSQLIVTTAIEQNDIDWTLGALLYDLAPSNDAAH